MNVVAAVAPHAALESAVANREPRSGHPLAQILDIAFQPIVDIHTGRVFGYEALMRNFGAVGDLPELEAAIVLRAGRLAHRRRPKGAWQGVPLSWPSGYNHPPMTAAP